MGRWIGDGPQIWAKASSVEWLADERRVLFSDPSSQVIPTAPEKCAPNGAWMLEGLHGESFLLTYFCHNMLSDYAS